MSDSITVTSYSTAGLNTQHTCAHTICEYDIVVQIVISKPAVSIDAVMT